MVLGLKVGTLGLACKGNHSTCRVGYGGCRLQSSKCSKTRSKLDCAVNCLQQFAGAACWERSNMYLMLSPKLC
jgi:hypothetical protein